MRFTRITITRIESRPARRFDINEELQSLGGALGLFSLRDKDKSRFRIFIAMVKALKRGDVLSSDDLADQLQLTRATVVHHLDGLMDAGIVEHAHGKYQLRVERLEDLVSLIQADVDKTLGELKLIARDLDVQLGLQSPRKPGRNTTVF